MSLWVKSDALRRGPTSQAGQLACVPLVTSQEENGTETSRFCQMGPSIGSTRLCQGWQHALEVRELYCACCGPCFNDVLTPDTAHAACRPAHAQPGLVRRAAPPVRPQAPCQVPAAYHSHLSQEFAAALHIQHWCALLRAHSTSLPPATSEILMGCAESTRCIRAQNAASHSTDTPESTSALQMHKQSTLCVCAGQSSSPDIAKWLAGHSDSSSSSASDDVLQTPDQMTRQ